MDKQAQCHNDMIQLLRALHTMSHGIEEKLENGPEKTLAKYTIRAIHGAAESLGVEHGVWEAVMEVTHLSTHMGLLIGHTTDSESSELLIETLYACVTDADHPTTKAVLEHIRAAVEVGMSLFGTLPVEDDPEEFVQEKDDHYLN